jgi:hypothetical protein
MKKNCLECNQEFEAHVREVKRGNGKFCTISCSTKFAAKERKKKVTTNCTCALCGVNFYLNTSKQKNSRSGLYFCCRKHKDEAQRIGGIKAIMPDHYGTGTGISTYRSKVLLINAAKCERCGWDKHIAGIVIHHKDRNGLNNNPENMEVLCACCHNIEHWG